MLSIDQNKAFLLHSADTVFNKALGVLFAPLACFNFNCLFLIQHMAQGKAAVDFIHYITLLDYIEYSKKCSQMLLYIQNFIQIEA